MQCKNFVLATNVPYSCHRMYILPQEEGVREGRRELGKEGWCSLVMWLRGKWYTGQAEETRIREKTFYYLSYIGLAKYILVRRSADILSVLSRGFFLAGRELGK